MFTKKDLIKIGCISCTLFLAPACSTFSDYHYGDYGSYDNYYEDGRAIPPGQRGGYVPRGRHVTVPESALLKDGAGPTSHKQKDKNWVRNQDPNSYTIELADDDKPASVAKKLYVAPKNKRMAQIKYQEGGTKRYTGVYGSYKTKAEADAALEKLSPELKSKAKIKPWSSIQSKKMDEPQEKQYTLPNIGG